MKFINACEQYLKSCKVVNSEQTYKKVKGYLKRSCELVGNHECSEIDKNTILELILYRKRINPKITNKTLNMYISYQWRTMVIFGIASHPCVHMCT